VCRCDVDADRRRAVEAAGDELTGDAVEVAALERLDVGAVEPLVPVLVGRHVADLVLLVAVGVGDALESVYDVSVDRAKLVELSEEIKRHYAELASRMAAFEERERAGNRDLPEDRMYM